MSVIQRIRDKGAWFIFGIIALALLAFVLQDGLGRRGGGIFSNTTTLGKVNGVIIDRSEFENKVSLTEKMYQGQAGSRDQVVNMVWGQEVDKIITGEEYDKLGLTISGKELTEVLFDEKTSPLKREFTDPQTGQFKEAEARNAFAQIKKSKNNDQITMINTAYIEPTIQQTLRTKYTSLLQSAAYVPKWMIEKTKADNSAIAGISYVAVPFATIVDSTIKVSDDEILAYAKKHHKLYDRDEESRTVSYVGFNATPNGADTTTAFNTVSTLKADFVAATDDKAYIGKVGSEIAFKDVYLSKAKIESSQKDTIVKLGTGQVFGPYIEGNNYVLAKLTGTKQQPDSAKVRHILIAFGDGKTAPVKSDSVAKKLADSIETVIKGGANFDSICLKFSDDPGSKMKGGLYDFFPQGQMVGPFNDFSFDKPVGTKGVVKTDFGYHYIEVLGQKNTQTAYKIAYLAKPITASNETVSAASTAAAQFAATSKNKAAFDENAKKANLTPVPSGEIKAADFSVPGLGASRSLVKWVYDNDPGDVSDPYEIGDKYVVAIITSASKPGLPSAGVLRPQVENLVKSEKKAKQILDTKFKGSSLEEIAKNAGVSVQRADSLVFSNPFIPGVGPESKVIGAAFNKDLKGKLSEPIAGSNGVYAIRVENIGAKPAMGDDNSIKQQLIQGQKSAAYRASEALKKAATIKDNRSKFY